MLSSLTVTQGRGNVSIVFSCGPTWMSVLISAVMLTLYTSVARHPLNFNQQEWVDMAGCVTWQTWSADPACLTC